MEKLNPTEGLLERACDLLVAIAQLHIMSRRPPMPVIKKLHDTCGICGVRWPCRTYRLATGDVE